MTGELEERPFALSTSNSPLRHPTPRTQRPDRHFPTHHLLPRPDPYRNRLLAAVAFIPFGGYAPMT